MWEITWVHVSVVVCQVDMATFLTRLHFLHDGARVSDRALEQLNELVADAFHFISVAAFDSQTRVEARVARASLLLRQVHVAADDDARVLL